MVQCQPLSQRLREGTKKAHRTVENFDFVRSFLRGVVNVDSYCRYLVDLEHVYQHLECSLRAHPTHPLVQPLILPVLWRQERLQADIAFFSRGFRQMPRPSESARRYGNWLRLLCEQRPELLVAHSYTRYMGDLSGGQILGRIAARAFGLKDEAGLAFYSFPQISDMRKFKLDYRARIDGLPVNDELAEDIVLEAVHAFACNGAILKALSGSAWLAMWRLLSPGALGVLNAARRENGQQRL